LGAQEERGQECGEVLAMCAGERVEIIDYEEVFCLSQLLKCLVIWSREDSLVTFADEGGGPVGGGGKRATMSFLKFASDFPLAETNKSISYETFFRSVEKEMKIILDLDIC